MESEWLFSPPSKYRYDPVFFLAGLFAPLVIPILLLGWVLSRSGWLVNNLWSRWFS